jgi:hypothetical protein
MRQLICPQKTQTHREALLQCRLTGGFVIFFALPFEAFPDSSQGTRKAVLNDEFKER